MRRMELDIALRLITDYYIGFLMSVEEDWLEECIDIYRRGQ